ncbi:MAG TPA: hypothetical protein PLI71_09950 [Clostridia bacterium]|nr:hypothetical protein [Clostridia bacterium]
MLLTDLLNAKKVFESHPEYGEYGESKKKDITDRLKFHLRVLSGTAETTCDLFLIEDIVKSGIDVNEPDEKENGWTPLDYCLEGNGFAKDKLLSLGAKRGKEA